MATTGIYGCYDHTNHWKITLADGSLSVCFLDGVVLLLPAVFSILFGSISLHGFLKSRPIKDDRHRWLTLVKLQLVVLHILILITISGLSINHVGSYDLRSLSPLINAMASIIILGIHVLETTRSRVPNDVTLVYWPFATVSLAMKVYQLATRDGISSSLVLRLYSILTVNTVLVLILEYFVPHFLSRRIHLDETEDPNNKEYEAPLLANSDFYSRLALTWFNPFLMKITKSKLEYDQLPNVDSSCESTASLKIFQNYWDQRKDDSSWSLVKSIAQAFGLHIAKAAFFEFLFDLANLAVPFLTRQLILFAASYWENKPMPFVYGWYIALEGFALLYIKSVCMTTCLTHILRGFITARGALSSMVYQKSLRLSSRSRNNRTMGQIVNLMAVDTETIIEMMWSLSDLWEIPIQFILSFISVFALLGSCVFVVFPILLILYPTQTWLVGKTKKLRKQQMEFNDERTKTTNEILLNVKSLKLYGWERALLGRLNEARNVKQLGNLRVLIFYQCLIGCIWYAIPGILTASVFGIYIYTTGEPMTADIVFPALTLLGMMTGNLFALPSTINTLIEAHVSLGRVADFLTAEETDSDAVQRLPAARTSEEAALAIEAATFAWEHTTDESSNVLENISLEINKGQLVCVVGKVGSGKSALLKSILGDVHKVEGKVTVKGSIAYVSQEAWLMNATLKENILFGHRYDPVFYQQTIKACALTPDLAILPDGDDTEIGERGVSLSGGQKARVSLARAVYARADVYIMDDPLSAVDEHVGKHLTDHVIGSTGLLSTKTKLLATNSIRILSKADSIILLEDKKIKESGTYASVMQSKSHLYELIKEHGLQDHETSTSSTASLVDTHSSISAEHSDDNSDENTSAFSSFSSFDRRNSKGSLRRASLETIKKRMRSSKNKKTTQNVESSQIGRVKAHVYTRYIEACGKSRVIFGIFALISLNAGALVNQLWLKSWTDSNAEHQSNYRVVYWLVGYVIIRAIMSCQRLVAGLAIRLGAALRAASILHDKMAVGVLRSPMQFFDTTPVGRIINRFSADVTAMDNSLGQMFMSTVDAFLSITLSVATILYAAPAVAAFLGCASFLYYYFQSYYQAASRELKRLLSTSKSPIFAHFQETLTGSLTIRAFEQTNRFNHLNHQYIDNNLRTLFLFRSSGRWLSYRLQSISAAIIAITCLATAFGASQLSISPGMIGVVMYYASLSTDMLNMFMRMLVQLESSIVSVERVLEYVDLPSESEEIVESNRPAEQWPAKGQVIFDHYSTRYRSNLDLVLKDINLKIEDKQKIGIVGRTGAGKSSLVMSLFRIIEPSDGTIVLDDVDITKIGLYDLRTRLSLIPQDSQIFQGTIRENLDPIGKYSDQQLWRALELSHLKTHVSSMEGQLEAAISEGGSNLSAGQRQLMCLGRALLHESSVLVLDEATASVDSQTDKLVQETIRAEFADRTIITIAHRLDTIIDSDKIVVLDKGHVAEFDSPEELLKRPDSMFYSLAKQGGLLNDDKIEGDN